MIASILVALILAEPGRTDTTCSEQCWPAATPRDPPVRARTDHPAPSVARTTALPAFSSTGGVPRGPQHRSSLVSATGSAVGLFMELVAVPHIEEFRGPACAGSDMACRHRRAMARAASRGSGGAAPDGPTDVHQQGTLNVVALNAAVERAVTRTAAVPR